MKNYIKLSVLVISLAAFTGIAACNTFEGMGRDVEKGGESMQRAADKDR